MASTKISFTPSSAGNRNKWTISLWLKRSKIGVEQVIASAYGDSNNQTQIKFDSSDQLYFNDEHGGNTNGRIVSNAKYRDTNGFYHLVFIWDKDNSTSDDKLRMYVNGSRITSFSNTGNAPSAVSEWNSGQVQQFGAKSSSDYFDGIMSHIHFCDGYAYEPTEFGQTDSNGVWTIKTSPSVTYGTNGFFILKDGNSVTDQSSNTNNWTASGNLTDLKDNPSNVFATWNPLMPNSITYSNGNTTCTQTADANYRNAWTTIATPTTGKWYAEFKAVSGFSAINKAIGYIDISQDFDADIHIEQYSIGGSYGSNGRVSYNQTIDTSVPTFTDGDIIGMALDLDNGKAYYHKNGTYINSGDPTSGSTGTGGYTMTTGKEYTFASITINQGGANVWSANFGNGYFGTTAVASAGTNASGNGVFEYDVPTGYTALCTKGLNGE